MNPIIQEILENSELTIVKLDPINDKVVYKVTKTNRKDLKGYTITWFCDKEVRASAEKMAKIGRTQFRHALERIFEDGCAYEGQTFKAL